MPPPREQPVNAAARLHQPASLPLTVRDALDHFQARLEARIARSPAPMAEDRMRRRVVLGILRRACSEQAIDTIDAFEAVLNACLDTGYREGPLLAFVFEVLERRLAARVRRRLARSGHDAGTDEVGDLVAASFEAIHRLLREADRAEHTVRYNLLLSIADHRAIDHLRRKRPVYLDTLDDLPADVACDLGLAGVIEDPERRLERQERRALARLLRAAVFGAVNALPDRDRAALVMVEALGCSYDVVAEQTGVKRTDVGNVVRRARLSRDRALVPRLRTVPGLEGHIGFSEMQEHRTLRLGMVQWSIEMGAGVCPHCLARDHRLHALPEGTATQHDCGAPISQRCASRSTPIQS